MSSAAAVFLPRAAAFLAGPSLTMGFRYHGAGEALFAQWFTGTGNAGDIRWLEVGVVADDRIWLNPALRIALGGAAALCSIHLVDARVVADVPDERDTWSARAGALLGIEGRLGVATWLALSLEPSVILRPARYDGTRGPGAFEGVFLGLRLALSFEWVQKPTSLAVTNQTATSSLASAPDTTNTSKTTVMPNQPSSRANFESARREGP
jgi:hypothetical protein